MHISILVSLLVLPIALAQNVFISFPADGTTIARGQNFTVEVDRPNSLSSSQEVALILGVQSCTPTGCAAPDDILGTILYNGPYAPKYDTPSGQKPPHQNFTLTMPMGMSVGRCQLGVVHVALIGAGRAPFLESKNVTLNIV